MKQHAPKIKLLGRLFAFSLVIFGGQRMVNAQLYFFDGNFSSWTFTNSGSGGGAATMTYQTSGGNPGSCLNVSTVTGMTHTGMGITESAWGIGVDPAWTVTQQLAGAQFTMGFDVLSGPGSFGQGQAVGLIIEQGAAYYLDIVSTPVTGFQTSWTTESFTGSFDAANFRLQAGAGPSQPDFSGATPTIFGFTAFNGDSGNLTQYYDNISLSVAPEPSTFVFGIAFVCAFMPILRWWREAGK
jgi:hypothetical protein